MDAPLASASLYVGDLDSSVTEGHLFEIFNQIGPVALIRVCRDATTRRSLGYAYVNYHNSSDAETALDTLNLSSIKGRPCRIMWSQRDPTLRKSGVGNLFIKNLDKSIDNKTLYDTFSVFGNILSCKVALDAHNCSKGYGFVHFETQEVADKAIEKLNGTTLGGKTIYVGPFISRKERVKNGDESYKFTNVFIKNLEEDINQDKLKDVFGAFGTLSSCVVMTNHEGKSKCFGFVNFENPEDAEKAVEALNGKPLTEGGKPLYVGRALKKSEREAELRQKYEHRRPENQGVNLYVKNLDDDIDDEKLRNEFGKFGQITSIKVMRDEKGNSRGFGFVCYRTADEANRAVGEMKGKMIGSKAIYVTIAQKKDYGKRSIYDHRNNGLGSLNMYSGVYSHVFYPQPHAYKQMLPRGRWGTPPPQYPVLSPNYGQSHRQNRGHNRQNYSGNRRYNTRSRDQQYYHHHHHRQSDSKQENKNLENKQETPKQQEQTEQKEQQHEQQEQQQPEQEQQEQEQQQQQEQQSAPNDSEQTSDEAQLLQEISQLSQGEQTMYLGERLFPLINNLDAENAGKVTGMLLDRYSSSEDLIRLIVNPDVLKEKVTEALEVLQAHTQSAAE